MAANDLGFELDFITVGKGERSGDAIAMRYGSLSGRQQVLIIDGGSKESGQKLVDHVKSTYGTERVDYVVNTHPDVDHSSGLSVVLENLDVGCLYMHRPWNHAGRIRDLFHDGRITDASLEERIRDALNAAHELEAIALKREIPMIEPFQGVAVGPHFRVLSPEEVWYVKDLLPNFERLPEVKKEATFAEALMGGVATVAKSVAELVAETMGVETLKEGGVTRPENESSVVLYGEVYEKRLLFTGDAGVQALSSAIIHAQLSGISLKDLDYIQVPHHGSRNNVSPTVLNEMMGKIAFVSASPGSKTHPRKVVTNAFRRRGAKVFPTRGGIMCQRHNRDLRPGYGDVPEIPFYDKVEA